MKKLFLLIVLILVLTSCIETEKTADKAEAEKTERLVSEAQRQVGLPAIKNFHEKKMLKMLYELRDKSDLVCHAYLFNKIKGEIGQYLGKCIGYGLPFSVQFSNPEKTLYEGGYQRGFGAIPQAEPNGLFMPEGLSATWLMLVDPKTNEPKPVYVEPSIIVSPFKLK